MPASSMSTTSPITGIHPTYPTYTPEQVEISVAPMVDVSDQYFRYLCRLLSKHVTLYTPMITDLSILRDEYGPLKHLQYSKCEHKLVAQLGGHNPETMAQAAKIMESMGYDEININLGCPAPSASKHSYGAVLMRDPQVFEMIQSVCTAVSIPVTLKMRIGVYDTLYQCNQIPDEQRYANLHAFVTQLIDRTDIRTVILHCRSAVLNFRPDRNLTAPTLIHSFAYRLKRDFPVLRVHANGEINSVDDIHKQLSHGVDGCMIGRAAWKNPFMLSQIDELVYGEQPFTRTRADVIQQYVEYAEQQLYIQLRLKQTVDNWKPVLKNLLSPLLHICSGTNSSKSFRVKLTDLNHRFRQYYIHSKRSSADETLDIRSIVDTALSEVDDAALFDNSNYVNVRAHNVATNPRKQSYFSVRQERRHALLLDTTDHRDSYDEDTADDANRMSAQMSAISLQN